MGLDLRDALRERLIVHPRLAQQQLWTAPGEGCRFRVLLPAEPPLPDDLELD